MGEDLFDDRDCHCSVPLFAEEGLGVTDFLLESAVDHLPFVRSGTLQERFVTVWSEQFEQLRVGELRLEVMLI